jgi:hypothetical protein
LTANNLLLVPNFEMLNVYHRLISNIRSLYSGFFLPEVVRVKKRQMNPTCLIQIPSDQEGLFKLAIQLRTFFYSPIYNTATVCFVGLFDGYLT